jgi:ribosomal protein L9
MTDVEIIEALKRCTSDDEHACNNCPSHKTQCVNLMKETLDLINRQQAELEDARNAVKSFKSKYKNALGVVREKQQVIESFTNIGKMYSEIKSEAIKEFAERMEAMSEYGTINVSPHQLDNLVKEMVGE